MKWPLLIRRVSGESMLPSLKPGQVIVGLCTGQPRVGQIVIIRHGGLEKIKRVAQVDGKKLYVLGDNAASSTDSRHFGWIDRRGALARVIWPRSG